jgi:hypothetical protein
VVDPLDAAQQVVAQGGVFEWLPDRLGAGPQYAPRFDDEDLVQLEQARQRLGEDVAYAACSLPSPAAFPDTAVLVQAHQDLLRSGRTTEALRNAELPVRVDAGADGAADAQALAGQIERVRALRVEIAEVGKSWVPGVRERLRAATAGHEFGLLEGLGRELEQAGQARRAYLARPVVPPPDQLASGFVQAVDNLAQGKRPLASAECSGVQHRPNGPSILYGSGARWRWAPETGDTWPDTSRCRASGASSRSAGTRSHPNSVWRPSPPTTPTGGWRPRPNMRFTGA